MRPPNPASSFLALGPWPLVLTVSVTLERRIVLLREYFQEAKEETKLIEFN